LFERVNVGAVLVAAVSSFLLGGLWYSPRMFGTVWGRAAGRIVDGKPVETSHRHPARVFGVSLVFAVVAAGAFAWWLGPKPELKHALDQALVVGLCFVATCFGINYQFADRRTAMWLVDAGYHTVQFLIFAVVLGLWH
jgi:hypothetical protein